MTTNYYIYDLRSSVILSWDEWHLSNGCNMNFTSDRHTDLSAIL